MAFHDDLLIQAIQLVHKEPSNPKQASLRRAVSTAYYALFHLLISEAVSNWLQAGLRAFLGRAFDHRPMKEASKRVSNASFPGQNPLLVEKLRFVTRTFVQLQDKRHTADYNNTVVWTRIEALTQVKEAEKAFTEWNMIRRDEIAQEYLVSLLVKHRD